MKIEQTEKGVRFSKTCSITWCLYEVTISLPQFRAWKEGGLIQDVCPELSAEQREFLINYWTPDEWNAMMGPET